jgi:putative membrane protein
LKGLIIRFLAATGALFLAAYIFKGIEVSGLAPAAAAVIIIGLLNVSIKPVLLLLTFPVNFVTLGLFGLVLNARILWSVARAVDGLTVSGFLPALGGAVVISLVNAYASEMA